jgi:peptide/nickel transport system permease protein
VAVIADSLVLPPAPAAPPARRLSRGYWAGVGRRLLRDKVALVAGAILLLIVLAAVFAPWIAPADPYKGSMLRRLKPVGDALYLLGSDELGRDMLTRLIYGGRLSLFMGVLPVLCAFAIGSTLGTLAGYIGGRLNTLVMRTIAESVTTQIRSRDYVEAARVSGAGTLRIVRVHVLGNVLGPIFVYATSLISVSMILASGLSFLGLGSKPPEPEWGLMLNTLRTAIYVQPLVAALPGAMIFITSISFNLLSDGLRSAMEVKS